MSKPSRPLKSAQTTDPLTHIHTKDDPRIFVFGSNRLGIHGGGAAAYASKSLGAAHGIAEGITGRTYALPTCSRPGVPLTLAEISVHVQRFIGLARLMPEARFFVSAVGTGIAGFTDKQVSALFIDAPLNCDMPPEWRQATGDL